MIKILNDSSWNIDIDKQIQTLFRQLSPNKKQTSLKELLFNQNNPLIFACYQENNKIVGIASMCMYKVISGHKGWIEDVVVDIGYRGKGIGKQLISKLIDEGVKAGLSEIYLFTEDEKKAAIHLYAMLGFKQKNSRLYNLKII
ncbi:GNAT family N-acetyltransferase [Aquimarina gracilis]|uniref:GNAT family N-acetyltransferase n=1 Tax=Aquimarina gracilis TaxID=874422 RepID=A0ABU5ZYK6_9FLAO|nr:GNAT family N-acetyltransferase [Aquimarina gracilis]MEB3346990.1 GNAT family N-acetyltransferase [Aquimarina gracilis]